MQKFKVQIELLMSRNTSKNKNHSASKTNITVTLTTQNKVVSIKAPMPCPAFTLLELIESHTQHLFPKWTYLESVKQDCLTDYKLQCGVGWIRNDCHLRCIYRNNQQYSGHGIQSYKIVRCIGVGGFSKVYLTRDKITGTFYAAKFIQKAKIKDKEDLILNEKRINENINFHFLVHMKEFISTQLYYIMILDYCPGGQLFHLQRKVIRFDQESARKYFIEVLLAIEYLHSQNIIYRDLKPENIMMDVKGHLKIADFGLAKKTKEKRYSFCGSLEYMSPEVLIREGHSFEVDYYCLGALLFEMVVGCPPFYEPNSPEVRTQQRILYEEVEFPSQFPLSFEIKDLIRKLLVKDPKKRLGHFGGTKEIKCHPWIGWLNREQWQEKRIQMPYPVDLDTFNFDCKDITASANRMLTSIRSEIANLHIRQEKHDFSKKLSQKILSPYRINKQTPTKPHRNLSVDKMKTVSSVLEPAKHKKTSKSKSKESYNLIKACYTSQAKIDLKKFLRYPTEIPELKAKSRSKDRISYLKRNTQMKQNHPHREIQTKKRRPRQQLTFVQIKRS